MMHPETYALLMSVRKVVRDLLDVLEEVGGSDLQRLTRAQERTYAIGAKWMADHPAPRPSGGRIAAPDSTP